VLKKLIYRNEIVIGLRRHSQYCHWNYY